MGLTEGFEPRGTAQVEDRGRAVDAVPIPQLADTDYLFWSDLYDLGRLKEDVTHIGFR